MNDSPEVSAQTGAESAPAQAPIVKPTVQAPSQDAGSVAVKQAYYLPDYGISVMATSVDDAIKQASKGSN